MPKRKPSSYPCPNCFKEFDSYDKRRVHFRHPLNFCKEMEPLMKNIFIVRPDTIEKLQELMKNGDISLEALKVDLVTKLSENLAQVGLGKIDICIHIYPSNIFQINISTDKGCAKTARSG